MNTDDRELVELLRRTFPPLGEPPRSAELWTRFERRLEERRIRIGGLDWLMAVVALALLAAVPDAVLWVLYHL